MTTPPPANAGLRSILFLGLFLAGIGSCDSCASARELDNGPPPSVSRPEYSGELNDLMNSVNQTIHNDPNRRPLAVAHIVVSLMLVTGGVWLLFRRKQAIWWIQNALAANLLWVIAHGTSVYLHIMSVVPTLRAQIEAGPSPPDAELPDPMLIANGSLLAAAMRAGVLLYLLWRVRRKSVRDELR